MESKSFEISVEDVGGKLRGIILERCKGLSLWIRFGKSSLRCLLEGVEVCYREESFEREVRSWEEEGRKFRLERHTNEAERFILCFVHDVEQKRFCLVFLEGRGILGGWVKLVEKLCSLGVITLFEVKVGCSPVGNKEVGMVMIRGRDLRSRDEQLGRYLVGRWGGAIVPVPDMALLRRWGVRLWNLKGGVSFSNLGGGLFLAEFEDAVEAKRMLRRGIRCFEHKVRAVGLPLQFWNKEVFRKLRDSCGGFVVVDNDTTNFVQLQWARLLVRSEGKDLRRRYNWWWALPILQSNYDGKCHHECQWRCQCK
ncbi:hypothetical protein CK203_082860 [Vitis vinifera]|uniref:DUF4283 domain-containing protein n=1 Tax=Vitis vinifera TaxID=29760 RepID=A0A438D6T7_VITVI|nr:hypothetical protein CK203_082860 [Vitis vinifera]